MRIDARPLTLLLAVTLAAAACGGAANDADSVAPGHLTARQRAKLQLVTVAPSMFRPAVHVTGTVDFDGDRSTQVLSPISGPVVRVLVDLGAKVNAGTPLATVASPDFAADVADYRKAQAAWVNAQRIATRDSALFANDALARQDLEQAQTDAAQAAADRQDALDALKAVGADAATLDAIERGLPVANPEGVIRAPIAGMVVERLITPGQLLAAGTTPSFTVADMATVWVEANVFERDLPDVHVGDAAAVVPSEGRDSLAGRVDYVGATVDPDTRATAVRIVTRNLHGVLKKGMYVNVAIRSRTPRRGILVPTSAVLRDANNLPFVFLVQNDSAYQRRPVTLGERVGDDYEITDGLTPGERVVGQGALFLQFAENQ